MCNDIQNDLGLPLKLQARPENISDKIKLAQLATLEL